MARLAFGVSGAVAGSFVGQPQLGMAAGSLIGGLFTNQDDIVNEGPRINEVPTTTSAFGVTKSIIYGTMPVTGNIIDKSKLRNIRHEEKQDSGGKGLNSGPDVVNVYYTAEIDLDIALGEVPIGSVIRVYANATLLIDTSPNSDVVSPPWLRYKFYDGNQNQLPDPTFEAIRGVGNVPAYRGTVRMVFTNFQLQSFNNQIPTFRFICSSFAESSLSYETKGEAGGSGVASVLSNKSNSLVYHVNEISGGILCRVYDQYSKEVVFSMQTPSGFNRLDEGGGAGLFSMPLVISGVTVPAGPNRHLWMNVEFGSDHRIIFYDAFSGQYLGDVDLGIPAIQNRQGIIASERLGMIFRVVDEGLASQLKSWSFVYTGNPLGGPIAYFENQSVLVPINDFSEEDWTWLEPPSYPEGTTRDGKVCFIGYDDVNLKSYVAIIDSSNPTITDKIEEITGGFFLSVNRRIVNKIFWDSLQNLFWLVGPDESSTNYTRWRAYDLDLNIVHDVQDLSNAYYNEVSRNGTFSSDLAAIVWTPLIVPSEIRSFNVVTLETSLVSDGTFPISDGAYDSSVYHHGSGTIWKSNNGSELDIVRIFNQTPGTFLLSSAFNDLCERAGLVSGQYVTNELDPRELKGYGIFTDGTYRSKMLSLQQAYLVDSIDEGDRIRFRFRGQSPIATISEDELAVVDNGGTGERTNIIIRKEMQLKLPGRTEVTYYNAETEYEQNTQLARREASYLEDNSTRISVDVVLDDDEGIQLADVINHNSHIESEVYEINTFVKYLYLTPGDVIEIKPDDDRTYVGRIIFKSFQGSFVRFICTREESSVLQSFLSGGKPEPRDLSVPNNSLTQYVPMDIPLLRDADNNAGHYMAGRGLDQNWTGGNVYRSQDLQNWSLAGTLLTFSTMGTVSGALLPGKKSIYWDRESVLTILVPEGVELSSCTEEEALQGLINSVAIGNNGSWEICNFVNAVLIDVNTYQVDTFLRGRIGTERVTDGHVTGENFILLSTENLIYIEDVLANLNVPSNFRSVSFGKNLYGDQVLDQLFTNTGVCLMPLAPAQFKAEVQSNLDIKYTWQPRTRLPLNNFWSGDTSDPENYHIVIVKNSDQSVLKDIKNLTAAEYTYTRVDQLADGLPTNTEELLDSTVYHISASLSFNEGRGYPSSISNLAGPPLHSYVAYAEQIGAIAIWQFDDVLDSPVCKDLFGNYDSTNEFVRLEKEPLFDSYRTSMEIGDGGGTGNTRTGLIPKAEVDVLDFSMSVMFQPREANGRGLQNILELINNRPNDTELMWIAWEADETISAGLVNYSGSDYIINSSFSTTLNETVHLVLTYKSTAYDVNGDLNLYINGSLAASGSFPVGPESSFDYDKRVITGYSVSTSAKRVNLQRNQIRCIFDHALTSKEVSDLHTLSKL